MGPIGSGNSVRCEIAGFESQTVVLSIKRENWEWSFHHEKTIQPYCDVVNLSLFI